MGIAGFWPDSKPVQQCLLHFAVNWDFPPPLSLVSALPFLTSEYLTHRWLAWGVESVRVVCDLVYERHIVLVKHFVVDVVVEIESSTRSFPNT